MGGKGSGGARVGSGPRRLTAAEIALRGGRLRGARRAEAASAKPGAGVVVPIADVLPPADLSDEQRTIWDALAPHAIANRRLTPATAFAFRLLCRLAAREQKMHDEIEAKGLTRVALDTKMDADGGGTQQIQEKANDLLTRHAALVARIETELRAFGLAPMGKEMAPAEDKPVANPLDRFIHRKRG